jgi:hypothetical protein
MAAPVLSPVTRRIPRVLLLSLGIFGALLTGCHEEDLDHARQVESLKTDLDEAKRRLSHVHKSLSAKDDELLLTKTTLEETQNRLAEKEQALTERNAALRTVQEELETLKKSDAIVFAEIRSLQRQGQTTIALTRYQKFIKDFPKSPLVGCVASAITEMTTIPREVRPSPPAATPDPKRHERELLKNFNEGYMTLQDLAPVLKKKSLTEVLALLGKPNQIFNDGTEIGYADKAVNPASGTKGMLIISFASGTVDTLRVEYAGRRYTP